MKNLIIPLIIILSLGCYAQNINPVSVNDYMIDQQILYDQLNYGYGIGEQDARVIIKTVTEYVDNADHSNCYNKEGVEKIWREDIDTINRQRAKIKKLEKKLSQYKYWYDKITNIYDKSMHDPNPSWISFTHEGTSYYFYDYTGELYRIIIKSGKPKREEISTSVLPKRTGYGVKFNISYPFNGRLPVLDKASGKIYHINL